MFKELDLNCVHPQISSPYSSRTIGCELGDLTPANYAASENIAVPSSGLIMHRSLRDLCISIVHFDLPAYCSAVTIVFI